jgi:hypothetical protein
MEDKMKLIYLALILFLICNASQSQNITSDSTTYFSPLKKYKIAFLKDSETVYLHSSNIDEVSNIKYKLLITNNLTGQTITKYYYDVYGNYVKGKPTPTSVIFSWISWSPDEDFLELPEENWSRAPDAPENRAINLNDKYSWTEGIDDIDHNFWLDDLHVIGDCNGDCGISVDMFDGVTGKMITIKDSESPKGYQIESAANDTLVVKSVLDNCSNPDDEKNFKSVKIAIPFTTLKQLIIGDQH